MNARQHVPNDDSDGFKKLRPPWGEWPPECNRRRPLGTYLLANDADPVSRDPQSPRVAPDDYHALDDLVVLFGGDAEARARIALRRDALVKHLVTCEECKIALAALLEAGSRTARLSDDQRAQLKQLYNRLSRAMYGPHFEEARPLYERYAGQWIAQGRRPKAAASPELAPVIRHVAHHAECEEAVRRLYSAHVAARLRAAIENVSAPAAAGAVQRPLPLDIASAETPEAELHWRELAREENPIRVRPGMRLTDYETYDIVVEKQAEGEMTLAVWGRDRLHDNRLRTLKLLRPEFVNDPALRAAFVEAALEWCRVAPRGRRHAAPQVVGVPVFDDAPAVLVSYAPQTLASVLDAAHRGGQPLTPAQAFGWAQQIAAALAALHRQKRSDGFTPYIHGDLKPDNILVDDEANAWLSDVGMHAVWSRARTTQSRRVHALARDGNNRQPGNTVVHHEEATSDEAELLFVAPLATSRGSVVGTLRYMAPECWLGVEALSPASDVYALGIVLYEIFAGTGGGPFIPHPHSAAEWFLAHETGPSRTLAGDAATTLAQGPLSGTLADDSTGPSAEERDSRARMILGQLDGLIRRCLESNPADRPSAADVFGRLAELAGRLGLQREPEPPAEAAALRADDPEHLHRLARSHGRAGQPAAQSDLLLGILAHTPSPDLWISLGSALYDQGYANLALRAYDAAEALEPTHPQQAEQPSAPILAFHRGNAYFRLGRPADALKAYDEALVHQQENVPAMWGAIAAQHRLAASAHGPAERLDHLNRAGERALAARSLAQGTPHPKVIDLHERVQRDVANVRRKVHGDYP